MSILIADINVSLREDKDKNISNVVDIGVS